MEEDLALQTIKYVCHKHNVDEINLDVLNDLIIHTPLSLYVFLNKVGMSFGEFRRCVSLKPIKVDNGDGCEWFTLILLCVKVRLVIVNLIEGGEDGRR